MRTLLRFTYSNPKKLKKKTVFLLNTMETKKDLQPISEMNILKIYEQREKYPFDQATSHNPLPIWALITITMHFEGGVAIIWRVWFYHEWPLSLNCRYLSREQCTPIILLWTSAASETAHQPRAPISPRYQCQFLLPSCYTWHSRSRKHCCYLDPA